MLKPDGLKMLVEKLGARYSEILGINLESRREEEIFKWFLAAILFGAPIRESSAIRTYKCFERYGILAPSRIIETGWDGLVRVLDEGGYTRYDFKTADKLLEVMNNLVAKYGGSLSRLHEGVKDPRDLEAEIMALGRGIGRVTVNIFLRELRGVWEKAKPDPQEFVVLAAGNLGIIRDDVEGDALQQLEEFWAKNRVPDKSFMNFESALLRLGRDFCRKRRCLQCMVRSYCDVKS
jgi:endonuclease III